MLESKVLTSESLLAKNKKQSVPNTCSVVIHLKVLTANQLKGQFTGIKLLSQEISGSL